MSKWATSIDELVRSFRDALITLVPIAERVHMPWRQPNAYDDWDRICRAIYQSIVVDSIENAEQIGASAPVPAYDLRILSYKKNSFLCNSASGSKSAFVGFETKSQPFDQSLFAILDDNFAVVEHSRIPTEEATFIFCSRNLEAGSPDFHDAITVFL
jgi:hypothetical protein